MEQKQKKSLRIERNSKDRKQKQIDNDMADMYCADWRWQRCLSALFDAASSRENSQSKKKKTDGEKKKNEK